MNSIETQKLGYVAYPVIIGEIQNLAEILIGLSGECDDFSSRRELLLKTEGIAVNRFAPIGVEKPDLISIKIYNESKYVSLIETVRDLESYESDKNKFWKTITTEFQNYIKENPHKLTLSSVIYSSDISVNADYIARKENIEDASYFSNYLENKDDVSTDKDTGGLIFTFEFVDEITLLALHDYHWIFDKWDSASEEDKEKSLENPIDSKTNPGFSIHYPQISNVVKDDVDFISVVFEYFDPINMTIMIQTPDKDINAICESKIIFNRVKTFFDKNVTVYDGKEITDAIREKYVGVFRQFGKNLLFLTKHNVINYENRSYAEMIFTC